MIDVCFLKLWFQPNILSIISGLVKTVTATRRLLSLAEMLSHDLGQHAGTQRTWHLYALHWRHNERDGVPNHQPHDCLLNRLFRRKPKKTSKLRVTGICAGNSPVTVNSPHKWPVTRKMFPFDDVVMWIFDTIFTHHMGTRWPTTIHDIVQDSSNSIANALELLQSCTKPSISHVHLVGKYGPWIVLDSQRTLITQSFTDQHAPNCCASLKCTVCEGTGKGLSGRVSVSEKSHDKWL